MAKKTKTERKQTVTLTLGPETLKLLDEIVSQVGKEVGPGFADRTGMASVLFVAGLTESCRVRKIEIPDGWTYNYD